SHRIFTAVKTNFHRGRFHCPMTGGLAWRGGWLGCLFSRAGRFAQSAPRAPHPIPRLPGTAHTGQTLASPSPTSRTPPSSSILVSRRRPSASLLSVLQPRRREEAAVRGAVPLSGCCASFVPHSPSLILARHRHCLLLPSTTVDASGSNLALVGRSSS
uniref:Uncharacterized protein n=4 Tax=Aegilops tauschii subsp. strangulata TaxID=200361 RepID=A0A452YI56_AEGTS